MACVVFLGPSLPLSKAREILPQAEFRPPVRRGDLETLGAGDVIGIVDGLLDQTLAISRGEIREAIGRGAVVFGAASMGALRAAELPEMHGVGKIVELYRSGAVERDDEVTVLVHPETNAPLTVPLINIRHAVSRLVSSGTLPRDDGDAIVDAALGLHYTERTYPNVLSVSQLADNRDAADIAVLLATFDLKREDAIELLETLDRTGLLTFSAEAGPATHMAPIHPRVRLHESPEAPVTIWESGDRVEFADLERFLKMTGQYPAHMRRVLARSPDLVRTPESFAMNDEAQVMLDRLRFQWGWETPEEAHVTLRDLGVGLDDLTDVLMDEVALDRRIAAAAGHAADPQVRSALRGALWIDALALKREAMRCASMKWFAACGRPAGPVSGADIEDARRTIVRMHQRYRWSTLAGVTDSLGLSQEDVERFVEDLALARRTGGPVAALLDGLEVESLRRPADDAASNERSLSAGLERAGIRPSPKALGARRFALAEPEAMSVAEKIAAQMGLTRIGLVGELDTLGVQIAQAFGNRSGWSSSFSSGKSLTREGARVGAIMEEVEIFAQDAYRPDVVAHASFTEGAGALPLIDPLELGLPFGTSYRPDQALDWSPTIDLLSGETVLVPTAVLVGDRVRHDVLYCPRLGGKVFSSSGLGSGFSRAEALLHSSAEYVERHAYRLAEIALDNPGGVGLRAFNFVDLASLPAGPRALADRYGRAGMVVRIVDITAEVAVPTFWVRIFEDPFSAGPSRSADGFACHPDPEVAVMMALLEAAQTRGGYIAGGREDYSLQARSLGRHERPRTAVPRSQVFWFGNDPPLAPFNLSAGCRVNDIASEIRFMAERVAAAGCSRFLVADLDCEPIRPASAVRVLIPGLEVTNPLFIGARARATTIRDLLPRR